MDKQPLVIEFIKKLNEFREKPVFENLNSFIDDNLGILDKALQTNQFYPFCNYSHLLSDSLRQLKEYNWKMVYSFKYRDEKMISLIDMLNRKIPEVERMTVVFDCMKDCLMKHIQLDVLPNEIFDGEKVYLANGYVIIPTGHPTLYTTLKVSPTKLNEKTSLDFKLLKGNFSSAEDAIRNHVDQDIITTIAIAKNTEFYSLFETSLPMVKEKYQEGLSHQSL